MQPRAGLSLLMAALELQDTAVGAEKLMRQLLAFQVFCLAS